MGPLKMECALFGMCSFWNVLKKECVHFGMGPMNKTLAICSHTVHMQY